jgi:hypothetical protein
MATPDLDHNSSEVEWSIQADYEHIDNEGQMHCAMTGFPRRKDEFVYRGAFIDEFVGFFTIGQDAAEQLARLIGWIDPDTLVSTPDEDLLAENVRLQEKLDDQQALLDSMRELVVE